PHVPPLNAYVRCAHHLVVRERPRNDDPLDFARALEQRVYLGVAVPLLDRKILDVAVAAADLDRLLGDLDSDLAGLQLRHRALGLLELAAVPPFPQRPPDQRAGRLDLGRHVGEHERDRLRREQGPAELLPFPGVMEGELEGGARDAQCLGSNDRARQLERLQRHRGALMRALARARELGVQLLHAAEHVLERNRAVLEEHLGGVRGADAHLPFLLALADALRPWRNDEARLAPRAELRLDGGDHDVDARDAAVCDEYLLAVDYPIAVLAHGARLHR